MTPLEAFARQSRGCASLGSPFMGRLMALMAERLTDAHPVGAEVLDWTGDPSPNADNVPLRLAGALHALKLEGLALTQVYPPNDVADDALWAAVQAAMVEFSPRIIDWLASPPQTNEVRRSAVILAGLAVLNRLRPGPVALFELGASGGLNLRADRFRLDGDGWRLGPEHSTVRLAPDWTGPAPPQHLPDVVARNGVDLNPLDPNVEAARLRLLAYLWPDQTNRLQRTEAAIEIARHVPADLYTGDAGEWLAGALGMCPDGVTPVVVHTIAWQYFPPETKSCVERAIARNPLPVARLAMEAGGGRGAGLTLSPEPDTPPVPMGRADFHGRWIDWTWSETTAF